LVNRKSNSPWGSSYKEGLPSTAVNDTVDIDQNVRATITTGVIDVATGQWQGITVNDAQMIPGATAEAIAASGTALFPGTANAENLDMTGYSNLFIALKVSNSGNYETVAVMGNDTQGGFGGLTPVAAATGLKGTGFGDPTDRSFEYLCFDDAENLAADVWNVFYVKNRLANQKNMQIQITNNSGGNSNIEFAYMRTV